MHRVLAIAGVGMISLATAADLQLPDPLVTAAGEKVTSVQQWKQQRRPELLELFRENIYGRVPVKPPAPAAFRVLRTDPHAMDGKATLKEVDVLLARSKSADPDQTATIHLVLFVPTSAPKPAPCFLLICNRDRSNIDPTRQVKSPFWPAEDIVSRGYAAAAFFNGDVAADKTNSFSTGVHKVFGPEHRQPDSWGTIAAWAWGASRVLDYLQTDPDVDGKRVAVVGHSRGGKTALWAGAEDERFAMAISNESGSTGAALARGKTGERIKDINRGFPFWFCEKYKSFNDHEQDLPVDQHELIALMAPRPVYVASATGDAWSHPRNEFEAAVQATPVYHLFGLKGLETKIFPDPEEPLQEGMVGYHLRKGTHNLTEYDWARFMDFADKTLKPVAKP